MKPFWQEVELPATEHLSACFRWDSAHCVRPRLECARPRGPPVTAGELIQVFVWLVDKDADTTPACHMQALLLLGDMA